MKTLLIIAGIALILSGCTTERKCNRKFPPQTMGITKDSIIRTTQTVYRDTTIFVYIKGETKYSTDTVWLKNLLKKTGKVDVVIGNNEWVNGIFEDANMPAIRIGHYKRSILEGTKIRRLMRENKKWQKRVPQYLLESITKR